MPDPDLLPCPFCGGEAFSVHIRDGRRVACRNPDCWVGGPQCFHGSPDMPSAEARAIAAWNRRAPIAAQPVEGLVERHRDQIIAPGDMHDQTAAALTATQARVEAAERERDDLKRDVSRQIDIATAECNRAAALEEVLSDLLGWAALRSDWLKVGPGAEPADHPISKARALLTDSPGHRSAGRERSDPSQESPASRGGETAG